MNTTRMHLRTHVRPRSIAISRASPPAPSIADGMIEHDATVGALLKKLDDLGIADNTIVHLHDRQRPAHEHVAGRRDDTVP